MYALAADLLEKYNLPFDVMLPLIDETARKVHELAPRDAQTGPDLFEILHSTSVSDSWQAFFLANFFGMMICSRCRTIYRDVLRLEGGMKFQANITY